MHSAGARKCPAELMTFTAWGQPEIRQIGRALGRRPAGVRHKSLGVGPTSVLKMYARCPIWMWLSQRERALLNPGELSELAQIFNSTNSAGPLSKCDLSITINVDYYRYETVPHYRAMKDELYYSTRLRLVEWKISSFTSWNYLYHCTHKHSLIV